MWLAPDAIATWEAVGVGKRGGQLQYSDLAIETALTLRLIFHLPLRQTEGFLTSIFGMLGLDLSAPDHTTLSRRGQHLDLPLRRAPAGAGLHLIVDSTRLSIVGEGEWAAAKDGGRGRRGWKKLHLGVDRSGVIVARALTEASVDDATTGITLIEATDGALGRVTADAAYDTIGFYEAAGARGATVVVPPTRTANVSRYGPRSSARDRTILAVKEIGRRRWKQTSGYHGPHAGASSHPQEARAPLPTGPHGRGPGPDTHGAVHGARDPRLITRPPRGACVAVTPNLVWIAQVGDCVQVLYDHGRSCVRGGGRGDGSRHATKGTRAPHSSWPAPGAVGTFT